MNAARRFIPEANGLYLLGSRETSEPHPTAGHGGPRSARRVHRKRGTKNFWCWWKCHV